MVAEVQGTQGPSLGPTHVLLELAGGELRLEPMLELRGDHVDVLYHGSPHSVTLGTPLKSLRVFASGACVLSSAATVTSVTPEEEPGSVRLRLAFGKRVGVGSEILALDGVVNDL